MADSLLGVGPHRICSPLDYANSHLRSSSSRHSGLPAMALGLSHKHSRLCPVPDPAHRLPGNNNKPPLLGTFNQGSTLNVLGDFLGNEGGALLPPDHYHSSEPRPQTYAHKLYFYNLYSLYTLSFMQRNDILCTGRFSTSVMLSLSVFFIPLLHCCPCGVVQYV